MAKARAKAPKSQYWVLDGDTQLVELEHIEGRLARGLQIDEVKGKDGHKHQDASGHGKEEELDRRIDPPLGITPDADEKVHGDEHHLPEDIEEDRDPGPPEAPDHPRLEEEEGNHEFLDPEGDRLPGAEDAEDGQEGGQQDQEQADAVDAQFVADPVVLDPPPVLHELHGGCRSSQRRRKAAGRRINSTREKTKATPLRVSCFLLVDEQEDDGARQMGRRSSSDRMGIPKIVHEHDSF